MLIKQASQLKELLKQLWQITMAITEIRTLELL